MQRFVGTLSFKGQTFQGWQTQQQGHSVQEHVEKTWSKLLDQKVKVHGASRTDAGVHARGFVFHFDAETELSMAKLRYAFNRLIHPAIYLQSLRKVAPSFEARYQKSLKTYSYQILMGERDPFLADTVMVIPKPLSIPLVKKAMKLFVGTHHFQAFTTKKEDGANFQRTIVRFQLRQRMRHLTFIIVGDGFMTYMVRMIIGTIIAYAQGKLTLAMIQDYLDNKVKGPVSYKAEPQGLCLEKVTYESKT